MRAINTKYIILNNNQCLYQGKNSFGKYGWGGSYPKPSQPHNYRFIIYALDIIIIEKNNI